MCMHRHFGKSFIVIVIFFAASTLDASNDQVAACKKSLSSVQNPSFTKALELLNDQQEEKGFCEFFNALKDAPRTKNRSMSQKEETLFQEILPLYLVGDCEEKVLQHLQKTPDNPALLFFLASCYANKREFEPFFYLFYSAYLVNPDCYLSFKMQGTLATLIAERAKTPEEKAAWKARAMDSFKNAFNEYEADLQLHKMMIYTANEGEKREVIQLIIGKIIEKNVQICRTELPFYVTHALRVQDSESAQRLIDKAKSWYEYSRIIDQLQQQVEESKHGRKP